MFPEEFTKQQVEQRINIENSWNKPGWVHHNLNPQLVREKEIDLSSQIEEEGKKLEKVENAEMQKKQMEEEKRKILEQQEKDLTDEQKKELREKLAALKLSSRFLPDSSITTFFGKPAFFNYGGVNTNPTTGGIVYGQYMKTHNINPHSGDNKPEFNQIHGRALLGGTVQIRAPGSRVAKKRPIRMTRHPVPPRVPDPMANKDKKEMTKVLAKIEGPKKNDIWPETFVQAKAKQLQILPPHFQEKHLKTKTDKTEDFTMQSPVKTTGPDESKTTHESPVHEKPRHEQSTQSSMGHKSDSDRQIEQKSH